MKSLPWFRMYTDFLDDPKLISLAFEDQRHFIAILALKSAGILDSGCEMRVLDRIVAQRIWIDYSIILDVKARLVNARLIEEDWQPVAWDKRQMRSDHDETNAERQRRYRENQRNALPNVDVTLPDKKRVDKKRVDKKIESTTNDIPAQLLQDFLEVRKAKHAGKLTETAIAGIQREADKAGLTLVEAVTACCEFGWQGFNAGWYAERQAKQTPKASFKAADTEAAIDRWQEQTGQIHPSRKRTVIDITPRMELQA